MAADVDASVLVLSLRHYKTAPSQPESS
ncbi:hypothetical protein HU200_023683 [Digitaria exilis]|uniref:Uncharacterized protein n=1 Tax=Digitaria exilis TaxID=1010633 RepID=A0A835EWN6_9POAL|nr:hypothetical protein HU200_023683 [Digitaria exilis]